MTIIITDSPSITITTDDLQEITIQSISDATLGEIDFSAGFSVNGGVITDHGLPTNPTDVSNKQYVDSAIINSIGISIQGYSSVLQATTASFTTTLATKLAGIETGATGDQTASEVPYSNVVSELPVTNVQAAIDAVYIATNQDASDVPYDDFVSGLVADNVQDAIDSIDTTQDNLISGTQNITFNNTVSKLSATTIKGAIDELAVKPYTTITVSSTLDPKNYITYVDASIGDITVTLPTAISNQGKPCNIKRIDNSTNTVTVAAQVGQTIDGLTTGSLDYLDNLTIISNNANWFIL